VSDKDNGAPGTLGNIGKAAEHGAHLVCPVHVGLFAHVRLYGVKDNQPRPGLPDSSLYALVGKGKPLLALINDKNTVKVCFGFHKAGLDGVAQTVLGGLVNHIEWLMRCHVGERLAVGTSGGKA